MTNKEALKTLKKFQKFRTGRSDNYPGPTAISEALNVAISLLESNFITCDWCHQKLSTAQRLEADIRKKFGSKN